MVKTIRAVNMELARVLVSNGVLVLKIMPNLFPIYSTLLSNFQFFLPIWTYRMRGSFKQPQEKREGALWAIARLNPILERKA